MFNFRKRNHQLSEVVNFSPLVLLDMSVLELSFGMMYELSCGHRKIELLPMINAQRNPPTHIKCKYCTVERVDFD